MLCHWRYLLDNIFGEVKSVSCLGVNNIKQRWDESGKPYKADTDDAAYATFQLKNGIVAQINSNWCTRVRRDDLVTFQVDGTNGSAGARLPKGRTPTRGGTRRPGGDTDRPAPVDF